MADGRADAPSSKSVHASSTTKSQIPAKQHRSEPDHGSLLWGLAASVIGIVIEAALGLIAASHSSRTPRYPRVLALGFLLVQIFKKGSDKFASPEASSTDELINEMAGIGLDIIDSGAWPHVDFLNDDIGRRFTSIVRVCFDREEFEKFETDEAGSTIIDMDVRRNILYRKVVWPLRCLLQDMELLDKEGRIKNIDDHRSSLADRHALAGDITTRTAARTAQGTQSAKLDARYLRIRIAVLDTGYNPKSPFFQDPRKLKRLVAWKDMTGKSNSVPADDDGHGSHVLSLAMRSASTADFCVARVAANTAALQSAAEVVAQALAWTAERESDIVVTSFGYPEEVDVIRRAIDQAIATAGSFNRSMLFFTAAANDGGNLTEMFPASCHSVIPIRGTDHTGKHEAFNPPTDSMRWRNFMTLGKDVPSSWLSSHDGDKCQSETSVATPIAAGIAAQILGDVKLMMDEQKCSSSIRTQLARLWTQKGMMRVLHWLCEKREHASDPCYLYSRDFMNLEEDERRARYLVAASEV
ncbi:hypothetical protein CAC42_6203 [Sphaceloma murrayae]|uniref:Peptidase S8/S53 domain-containing protein n=1 Tax=Sphaceloma murrayae TaxID=2082308 RepID=A0A2K1QTJ6_9PEZI|nr:hypothetical protein CAC42_6203 [Sphaceloma murrayae]